MTQREGDQNRNKEKFMAQGAAEADIKIRVSGRIWVSPIVIGGVCFVIAGIFLAAAPDPFDLSIVLHWSGWENAAVGCLWVAVGLWLRTFGVDLTPESAKLRGLRRRSIPWQDVQAVVHHRRLDTWGVRLILESGRPVMLRAPTTWWGIGTAEYERDFERLGQWWLAHRGASWRPMRPEAPSLPTQE